MTTLADGSVAVTATGMEKMMAMMQHMNDKIAELEARPVQKPRKARGARKGKGKKVNPTHVDGADEWIGPFEQYYTMPEIKEQKTELKNGKFRYKGKQLRFGTGVEGWEAALEYAKENDDVVSLVEQKTGWTARAGVDLKENSLKS